MVVRNIGLDVKPPKTGCNDPICPFHGSISLRGRVFEGTVSTSKSPKTVSVERAYLHYYPKYSRYERRRSKTLAHNPPSIAAETTTPTTIPQCQPLTHNATFLLLDRQ